PLHPAEPDGGTPPAGLGVSWLTSAGALAAPMRFCLPTGLMNDNAAELKTSAERRREGGAMRGQIVHIEIPADDTAKGREFWGSLFGWEFQAYPGPFGYQMARISAQRAGAFSN